MWLILKLPLKIKSGLNARGRHRSTRNYFHRHFRSRLGCCPREPAQIERAAPIERVGQSEAHNCGVLRNYGVAHNCAAGLPAVTGNPAAVLPPVAVAAPAWA